MKEKSQFEKNAADKQVELLSGALNGTVSAAATGSMPQERAIPSFIRQAWRSVRSTPCSWLCTRIRTDARATSSPYIAKQRQEANPSRNTKRSTVPVL